MARLLERNPPQGAVTSDAAPTAVVLGGGANGLSLVRSLARAGLHPMVVVDTAYDIASMSRYARRAVVSGFEGKGFVSELLRLRAAMPHGAVLFFADDRPLLTVSQYRDAVAPWFSFELPSHQLLVDLTSKERFFQLAQRSGFPVPATHLVKSRDDLSVLPGLRLPLCVKPNSRSPAYDGSFQKAYRVETLAEAQSLCARVLDVVGEVIVQEWIEGTNDAIYFCLCYLGPGAPVCFTGRKGRSFPPQTGWTASCWAAPEAAAELEDLTIRFFRSVGLTSGFASMEYKRDTRDGSFRFVEPTVGRTDLQVELSAVCGVNLCHVGYCDAAKQSRPALKLDPTHVWRDEFRDFLAARMLGTGCSYPPGHRIHNAYWRWDDPAPALLEVAQTASNSLRRSMTRVLKTKAISSPTNKRAG
ncbi:hypothetical protein JQ616_37330 [Bradyrhizobium tropiciagri]|uniref:carboxylate--amine ligase n=1 Tax=Bradyrhizobium tropiciagri TaxID=312253 RepID=UPI001BA62C93|nr:hypothetical protein [Bradyrhizobium tropiciagri]MBR0900649.1 hypothetical protein [Bradyrhizobium tropiciagri]